MTWEEERELWRSYCKLLTEELNEVVGLAYAHGWRSTRGEAGQRARKILHINQHCEELVHDDCTGECEQCILEIEGFCPEDCPECLDEAEE